jgi:hypothetical protein
MKSKILKLTGFALLAFVFGIVGALTVNKWDRKKENVGFRDNPANFTVTGLNRSGTSTGIDFVAASEKCRPTVVFIKSRPF